MELPHVASGRQTQMKNFEDMLVDLILTGEISEEVNEKDHGFLSGLHGVLSDLHGVWSGFDLLTFMFYLTILSALITFTYFAFRRELGFLRQPRQRQLIENDTSRIQNLTSHSDWVKAKSYKGHQKSNHMKYDSQLAFAKPYSLPSQTRIQRNVKGDSKPIGCLRSSPIIPRKNKNGIKEASVLSGNMPHRPIVEANIYSETSRTLTQVVTSGVTNRDQDPNTGRGSKLDTSKTRQAQNEQENTTRASENIKLYADQKQALHLDSSGTFQEKSESKMEKAKKVYSASGRAHCRLWRDNSSCDDKDSLSAAAIRCVVQKTLLRKSHSLSSVEFIKEIYNRKKRAADFFRNDVTNHTQNINPVNLQMYMSRLLLEGMPESYTTYHERKVRAISQSKLKSSVYSLEDHELGRCNSHYRSMDSSRVALERNNQSSGWSLIPVLKKRAGDSCRNSVSSFENHYGLTGLSKPQPCGQPRGASAERHDEKKSSGKLCDGQSTTQTDPTCRRFATSGDGSPAKRRRNSVGRVSNRNFQRGFNNKPTTNNPEGHATFNVTTKWPKQRERRRGTNLENSESKPQSDLSTTSFGSTIVSKIMDSLMDVQRSHTKQKSRHSKKRHVTSKLSSEFKNSASESQDKRVSRSSVKDVAHYNRPVYFPYDYLRSMTKERKCCLQDFSTSKNPSEQKETPLAFGIGTRRIPNSKDLLFANKNSLTKNCTAVPISRLCKPSTVASSFSGCSADSVFSPAESEEDSLSKAPQRKTVVQSRDPMPSSHRQNYQNMLHQSASTEAVVRRLEGIQNHTGSREVQKGDSDSMGSERRGHGDQNAEHVYMCKFSTDNESCDVDLKKIDNPVTSHSTSCVDNVDNSQSFISSKDMREAERVQKDTWPLSYDTTPSPPGSYRKVNSTSYEKSIGRKSRIPLPQRSLQKASERITPNGSADNECPKVAGYRKRDSSRVPVILSYWQKEGPRNWPLITIDENIPQIRKRELRRWGLKSHEDKRRSLVHVNLLNHRRYTSTNRYSIGQRKQTLEREPQYSKESDETTHENSDSESSQSCSHGKHESRVRTILTEEHAITDVVPAPNDSITDFKVSTSDDDNTETLKMRQENIKQWILTLIPQFKPEKKWIPPSLERKYARGNLTAFACKTSSQQSEVPQACVGENENKLNLKNDAQKEVVQNQPIQTQPPRTHLISVVSNNSGQGDCETRVYETSVQKIEVDQAVPEIKQKRKESAASCVPANPKFTAPPKEKLWGNIVDETKRDNPSRVSSAKTFDKNFERKMASLILAKQISPNEKSGNSSQSYQLEQGFSPLMKALMAFKKLKPIFQRTSETPRCQKLTLSKPILRLKESEEDSTSQGDNFPITCVTYKDYYSRSDYMSSAGSQIVSTNTLRFATELESLKKKFNTAKTNRKGRFLRTTNTRECVATASRSSSPAISSKRTGSILMNPNKSISEKPHTKVSSGQIVHARSEWFKRSNNKDGVPVPSFKLTFKSRYQQVQHASKNNGDPRQENLAFQSRQMQSSKQLISPYKQANHYHKRPVNSPKNESWIYKVINVPSRVSMRFDLPHGRLELKNDKKNVSHATHNPLKLCNKNAEPKKTEVHHKTNTLNSNNKSCFSKQLNNQVHVFHSPRNPSHQFQKPCLSSPHTDVHLVNKKNVTSPTHGPYGLKHKQIFSSYSQCAIQRHNVHDSNIYAQVITARKFDDTRAKLMSKKDDKIILNASSRSKTPNETTVLKGVLHFGIKKPTPEPDSVIENEFHRKSLTSGEQKCIHGVNSVSSTSPTLVKDLRPGCKTIISSKKLIDKTENKKISMPQMRPVSRESSLGISLLEGSVQVQSYRKSKTPKQLASVNSRAAVKVDNSPKVLKGSNRVHQRRKKDTKCHARDSLSISKESLAQRRLIPPNLDIHGTKNLRSHRKSLNDPSDLTSALDMSTTGSSYMNTPLHKAVPELLSTGQPAKDNETPGSSKGKMTQPKMSNWKGRAMPVSPCPTPTARHHLGNIDELREKYLKEMKSKYLYRQLPLDISPSGCCKSIIDHYQYEMMALNRGNYFHNAGSKRRQCQAHVRDDQKVRTRETSSASLSQMNEKNARPCSRLKDSCSMSETQERGSRNTAFKPSHIWKLSIQEYDERSRHSDLVLESSGPTKKDKSQESLMVVRRESSTKIMRDAQGDEERVTPLNSDHTKCGTPISTPHEVSGAHSKVSVMLGDTEETNEPNSQDGFSLSQSSINTDISRVENAAGKCAPSVDETVQEMKSNPQQATNSTSPQQIQKKRSVQITDNLDIQPLTKIRREHHVGVREDEKSETSEKISLSGTGDLKGDVRPQAIGALDITHSGHGQLVNQKNEKSSPRDCWKHQDDSKVGHAKLLDSHKLFSNQTNLTKRHSKVRVIFKKSPTLKQKNSPHQQYRGPIPILSKEKFNQQRYNAPKPEPYRNDFSRAFAMNNQQPYLIKVNSNRPEHDKKSVGASPKISPGQANPRIFPVTQNKKLQKDLGGLSGPLDTSSQMPPKASPPSTNLYLRTNGIVDVAAKEHVFGELGLMSKKHVLGAPGQGVRKSSCIRFRGTKNKKYVTSALLYTKKKLGFSAPEQSPTSYRRPALGENNSAHRSTWDSKIQVENTDNNFRLSSNDDRCFSEQIRFGGLQGGDTNRWTNNNYQSADNCISAPPDDNYKHFDHAVLPTLRHQSLSASCCKSRDVTPKGKVHFLSSTNEMTDSVVLVKTSPHTASNCSLKQDGAFAELQVASGAPNNLAGLSSQSGESTSTQISFDWYKPSASSTGRVTERAYQATQNTPFKQVFVDPKNNSDVWIRIAPGPSLHANTSLSESNVNGQGSKENVLQFSCGTSKKLTCLYEVAVASNVNVNGDMFYNKEGDRKIRLFSAADSSQPPTREMSGEYYSKERDGHRPPDEPHQLGEFQDELTERTGLTNLSTLYQTLQHTYNKANQAFHAKWILVHNYHYISLGQSPQLTTSGAMGYKRDYNNTQTMQTSQNRPQGLHADPCRFMVGALQQGDGEINHDIYQQMTSGQTNHPTENCRQKHSDSKRFPTSNMNVFSSGRTGSRYEETGAHFDSGCSFDEELSGEQRHPTVEVSYLTAKPLTSGGILAYNQGQPNLTLLPESERQQTQSQFKSGQTQSQLGPTFQCEKNPATDRTNISVWTKTADGTTLLGESHI